MPLCDEFVTYCQNFDFKIKRDYQKISYERREYESVDEKSLSYTMCSKKTKKKSGSKVLIVKNCGKVHMTIEKY